MNTLGIILVGTILVCAIMALVCMGVVIYKLSKLDAGNDND